MTVLSAQSIREMRIVDPCRTAHRDLSGNSAGLGPCGYDLTIDQDVTLWPGEFKLASVAERLSLSSSIVGIVHDKSSLARRGLAVQNTVAEPGWRGYLTLELSNHAKTGVIELKRGDAVAQIIFHVLDAPTEQPYAGKYQDQERGPKEAR